MRRYRSLAVAVFVAGCAAQPSPDRETASGGDVAPTKFAATDSPDATTLDEALKLGFKVVDEDGRLLYCRESMRLGSHVRKDKTCLTEQEFLAARTDSQRNFEAMKKYKVPPPVPPPGAGR